MAAWCYAGSIPPLAFRHIHQGTSHHSCVSVLCIFCFLAGRVISTSVGLWSCMNLWVDMWMFVQDYDCLLNTMGFLCVAWRQIY